MATHSPRTDQTGDFTRDRLTLLAYGMVTILGFGVASLGPAMPSLRVDLGISRTVGGLHFTALALGATLAGLVIERVTGSWGRRRVFWWGGAGLAGGSLLIGGGWHPTVTLPGALLMGVCTAAMGAVVQATLADRHQAHRTVALTEANTAMSMGSVIPAAFIGASVAVGAGWRPAFLVPLLAWSALLAVRRTEAFPPANPPETPGRRRPLPRAYWLYWAALIPSVAAEWSVGAWGAGYLVDVAGSSEGTASLLMTAFFGAILLGRLLGARAARKIEPFPLLVAAAATAMAGILLFWGSDTVVPVVGGLLLTGLGISMQFPVLLSLAMGTAPDRSDTTAARVNIAAGGSVVVAPLTLGVIADQSSIRTAFGIVPGLFVLVVALAALGRRNRRDP